MPLFVFSAMRQVTLALKKAVLLLVSWCRVRNQFEMSVGNLKIKKTFRGIVMIKN